jgi:tetratricopeptide (TPR) repeat protein
VSRAAAAFLLLTGVPVAAQVSPRPAFRSGNPGEVTPDGAATGVTAELLDRMMDRLAEDTYREGREKLERGELLAALASLEQAAGFDPDRSAILFDLGVVSLRLGNLERAEHYLRRVRELDPEREGLAERLADVVLQREPEPAELDQLDRWLESARERSGPTTSLLLRQARVAAKLQEPGRAEGLYREVLARAEANDSLRLELGDFYRGSDREDEALAWYREVDPESEAWDEARQRIWRIEVDRQARRFGWTRPSLDVSERARALVARARTVLAQERRGEAEAALREAIAEAPQLTEARVLLGDILRNRGDVEGAELEYLRGLALDQGSAPAHARLGELYLLAGESSRAAEALVLLTRALQLRPDWNEVQLQLARAYRVTGDLPRARQTLRAYLAGHPSEEGRARAEELEHTIEGLLAGGELVEPEHGGAPERRELVARLNRVRAHLSRGETDAAMAELRRIVTEERGPEVRNLEGRLLHAVGRLDESAEAFGASLELAPEQADVHQQLGVVLLGLGRDVEARHHFERAEQLGELDATYHLGRFLVRAAGHHALLAKVNTLLEGRERLTRFLERSAPDSAYVEDARALRRVVDRRLAGSAGLALGFLVVPIGGGLLYRRRRWGGADLATLIANHPESGPDVQRLLSAIRHEVLKHNTMALSGLVEALERGEDPSEHLQHLRRSLFGGEGDERAVAARFHDYVAELRRVGQAYGLRLNLKRKDAALAPIHQGFAILRRLGRRTSGLGDSAQRRRRQVLSQLELASDLLNRSAYHAVQSLLTRLRVLIVDRDLLIGMFDRARMEPAFANLRIEPLDLELDLDLPCGVRIPRGPFEDVLSNLFRNALQASQRHDVSPVRVGLAVRAELHPITGHERIRFAVRDASPERLVLEQLLGREIEGGLGLVAKLVSNYDGTLDVETGHQGWNKAVVFKLPRQEVEP